MVKRHANEDFVCPPRVNETFQTDAWSCGLWSVRWIERSLRELRGEGRMAPPTIRDLMLRGNVYIENIKASEKKATAEAAAKAKAKAKAKAFSSGTSMAKKQIEPTFQTFEAALDASFECSKCYYTRVGTKGCRACMGEWFEQIRQKHWK